MNERLIVVGVSSASVLLHLILFYFFKRGIRKKAKYIMYPNFSESGPKDID